MVDEPIPICLAFIYEGIAVNAYFWPMMFEYKYYPDLTELPNAYFWPMMFEYKYYSDLTELPHFRSTLS